MKLLLTGGTGFFGRALLREWDNDFQSGRLVPMVTILSRSPESFLKNYTEFADREWLSFHKGNILDKASFPEGKQFTHILHAATESTVGLSLQPLQRYDEILGGTRNILDYAVECGVRHFLLTSSGGVYGEQPETVEQIPESYMGAPDPRDTMSAYSHAKRASEHLCCLYNERYDLNAVIARCFSFVGRDLPLNVHYAIGNFIRDALVEDEIHINGNGSPIRSYMSQIDLARWLMCILEKGEQGRAYNVGSDKQISILDLAYLVRDRLAPKKEVVIKNSGATFANRNLYVPCTQRAQNELGLRMTISLQEAIDEFSI